MSGLLGFIISMVLLLGVGAIFFITIDAVAKDAMLAKIAKIAVGCLLLVVFIMAIANVLGFGGSAFAVAPMNVIAFAVGVLILLVVLYVVDLILTWIGANMGVGEPIVAAIRYIITAVALIALLLLAGKALLSGGQIGSILGSHTPSIMQPERR